MDQDRREFLKQSAKGITFCCAMTQWSNLLHGDSEEKPNSPIDEYIEKVSQEMTYCAYRCTKECDWLMASLQNDTEAMKEQAEGWSKRHNNQKIPEDQMFCFGCKPVDKPLGYIVKQCMVRQCAIEKKYETCIECSDLATCDKALWTNYPGHRDYVLKLQKEKKDQEGKE